MQTRHLQTQATNDKQIADMLQAIQDPKFKEKMREVETGLEILDWMKKEAEADKASKQKGPLRR